jgi:ribosome recycling factor
MNTSQIFSKMNQDTDKSIDHVMNEFKTLHTGKANSSMVENVSVDVYGSAMKLRDIAAITTPDARTIQIQPWDKSTCAPIEKALLEAKIGITPIITGEIIRLPIPELSGERREELCKMAQGFAEQSRVGIRASTKEAMDALKLHKKMDCRKMMLKEQKKMCKKIQMMRGKNQRCLSSKEADLEQG